MVTRDQLTSLFIHFAMSSLQHKQQQKIHEYQARKHTDVIREFKHDVYGKRQTAKMKVLPSLFNCVYSRVKLFVFVINSRRRYSIFVCSIYGLKAKNSKSELVFAVCRLPLTSCLTSLFMHKYPRILLLFISFYS